MLKASHVRTKRAAFADESMSSTPASTCGWLPTMPTAWPPSRAKPQTMFLREAGVHLEELAVVDDRAITCSCRTACSGVGDQRSSSGPAVAGSVGAANGGGSRLFDGRNESR